MAYLNLILPQAKGQANVETSLPTLITSIFSFETLILLYMYAGLYKGDPRFAWIPGDPTGLFFALSVVVGLLIMLFNKVDMRGLYVVIAMLALVVWLVITLIWSPSEIYGPNKVFYNMATLELWAVIAAALIIAPDPIRLRRLFSLLLLLSIWWGIEAIIASIETGGKTSLFVGSTNYLGLGRLCGLGMSIAFVAWLFMKRFRILFFFLFVGLGVVIALAGGRGPLLSVAVALLIPIVVGLRLAKQNLFYTRQQRLAAMVVSLAVIGLAIYVSSAEELPRTLDRLMGTTGGGELKGTAGDRANTYERAVELWQLNFVLGHGAGSWPLLNGRPDDFPSHPHNLFLELLVESGVVGLVIFLILLTNSLKRISLVQMASDPLAMTTVLVTVNMFCNTMVSGDLSDNRTLFLLIGLLAYFAFTKKPVSQQINKYPNPRI